MSTIFMNDKGLASLVAAIYEQAAEDMLFGYRLTRKRMQDIKISKEDVKYNTPCRGCSLDNDGGACRDICEKYCEEYAAFVEKIKTEKLNKAHINGNALIKDCERFFRNDPYMQLSDPEAIIKKLRQKARYKR